MAKRVWKINVDPSGMRAVIKRDGEVVGEMWFYKHQYMTEFLGIVHAQEVSKPDDRED